MKYLKLNTTHPNQTLPKRGNKMNIKRVVAGFMLWFVILGFSSCMEIPDELKTAISILEKYQDANYYDKKWRVQNRDLLFHPDNNALGLSISYKTVDLPHSSLFGTSVFNDYKIVDIKKSADDFVITNKQGDMEKQTNVPCYFVKVQYHVIAHIFDDSKYEIYTTPKDVDWYWILIIDSKDGQYKLYDELPTFKVKFTSINAFSTNIDKFTQGKEILQKLKTN